MPRSTFFEPWTVTGLLLIAVSIYAFLVHGEYDFGGDESATARMTAGALGYEVKLPLPGAVPLLIVLGFAGFWMLHGVIQGRLGRLDRSLAPGINAAVPVFAVFIMIAVSGRVSFSAPVVAGLVMLFTLPGSRAYPWPCSPAPMALFYGGLAVDVVTRGALLISFWPALLLFGAFIPWHRRLAGYWWPSHLPRLARRRKSMTLIELLIVIALMSILIVAASNASMTTVRSLARQEDWRAAVGLAQDELALLRGREALPPPGIYPVDASLAEVYPFAHQAQVEITEGPEESVRRVRVIVSIRGDANDRDLALTALLPARRLEEAAP